MANIAENYVSQITQSFTFCSKRCRLFHFRPNCFFLFVCLFVQVNFYKKDTEFLQFSHKLTYDCTHILHYFGLDDKSSSSTNCRRTSIRRFVSRSAHRTPNFANCEFQFPQFKVLQSVFLFNITSYIGIFDCILILIQNFYLEKRLKK